MFYNVFALDQRPNFGEVFAVMDRWDPDESPAMVQRIRERLEQIPGARFNVELFQNGAPIASPVALRITGEDLDMLRELAARVEVILRTTPGARDVINPVANNGIDLDVGLDEAKAALLNIAPGEARRAVRLALSGENAAAFRDEEGDSYRVVVRLPLSGTQPISALDQVYVASRTGEAIALSQISNPRLESVPPRSSVTSCSDRSPSQPMPNPARFLPGSAARLWPRSMRSSFRRDIACPQAARRKRSIPCSAGWGRSF